MENKYNFTYHISNLINNKSYVGAHCTDDLNDGYFGGGKALIKAIQQYARNNFIMHHLCFFDTRAEVFKEEEWIVDEKWVKSNDNYNLQLGGISPFRKIKGYKVKDSSKMNKASVGIPRSEDTKRKISKSLTGRKYTGDRLKNMTKANRIKSYPEYIKQYIFVEPDGSEFIFNGLEKLIDYLKVNVKTVYKIINGEYKGTKFKGVNIMII